MRSRSRRTPPPAPDPRLVEKIAQIREHPPKNLKRIPGPRAILFYLQQDTSLQATSIPLPRSTRTVWKILRRLGYILDAPERKRKPLEPRDPLEEVQMDFKDATTVPADPDGKRAHAVEVLHFVDAGTSMVLSAQHGADFHAETALEGVMQFFREYGLPPMLTFENDPRFVGKSLGRDFPSALCRLLLCLGVTPNVIPPHRPDLNAYVERYHQTFNQECLQVHRPSILQEVQEVTAEFVRHYNDERPHQGRSCGNQPPRKAFPLLPRLPALPTSVNPDAWLQAVDGQAFARRVGADGCVTVDHEPYYISQALAKQQVVLFVNAAERSFDVWLGKEGVKRVPIKGLHGTEPMPLEQYVRLMKEEARSEERRRQLAHRKLRQLSLWA